MNSRSVLCSLLGFALFCASPGLCAAQQVARLPQFEQFPAHIYRGNLKIPQSVHKDPEGDWRDEAGKLVPPPAVNFAGEYYLAAHSCGTCCRYYSLNNLRTGSTVHQVSMFDAGDTRPVTKDGHSYVAVLYFKRDSALLMVQYELDLCTPIENNQCRQRYFVFKDGKFAAISKTLVSCTKERSEPE